ncbi:DapH/DapD/GlmU-related protein [Sulfuricurvum sp.]|uniref:DapH/DapD/GlmU-related protein n=1 Tax=Sulfuricurvum sp. TaxID=2025608 RepID=UPI003BB4C3F1
MKKRLAIIGGGGFAKEIIEVALLNGFEIIGIFAEHNNLIAYPHLGYLDELLSKRDTFDYVHIAFGGINQTGVANRAKIIHFLDKNCIPSATLISPYARISTNVTIAEGTYIAHNALISCDARIDAHVIINTASLIGHDAHIGKNTTVSPQAFIGGESIIGKNTLISAGVMIKQGITIGENCIIGMGSIIQRSIQSNMLMVHNHTKPVALH